MISPGWRLGLTLLAATAVVTMISLAQRHYEGLLQKVNTLTSDKTALETSLSVEKSAVKSLKDSVDDWRVAYDKMKSSQEELSRVNRQAQSENRRLNELLGRHDLAALARSKPGLVETRLNDGTARALRLLECASTPGGCSPGGGAPSPDNDLPSAAPASPDTPAEVGRRHAQ